MSIEAFGTRRVRESLKAIGQYLDDAAQIAAAVSPAHVIKLDTEAATQKPGPRLTDVDPPVIKFTKGTPENVDLDVTGSNLEKVMQFKLVRGAEQRAVVVKGASKNAFTARFTNILAPTPGMYDAWVVDDEGQTFVLDDAVRIKVRKASRKHPPAGARQPKRLTAGKRAATAGAAAGRPALTPTTKP